jgi:hypothetical protein
MDIEIVIEGVTSLVLEKEIKKRIRVACKNAMGRWRIMLSPSETRGGWDLGVEAPTHRHFISFDDAVERLPELVGARLSRLVFASEQLDQRPVSRAAVGAGK